MIKITLQGMKAEHKTPSGQILVEYVATMPKGLIDNPAYVKAENCTYTRITGNKKTYKVLFVNARENERVVSLELYCE